MPLLLKIYIYIYGEYKVPVETAKITFYKISQCGYYPFGEPNNKTFGDIKSTLIDVRKWSAGKELAATKTYESSDGADFMPVYLMDIQQGIGSWVVTMWNQTPSTDGQVASAIGTSSVGSAEVVMNAVPEGGIPGFATYFWFIPSHNVFASIRFQHLVTGQKPLQNYLESFLEKFSQHVVYKNPADGVDIEIAGYRQDANSNIEKVYPRFRTTLFRKPGAHDFLIKNADSIRKVLRKTALKLNRPVDLDSWQRFLKWSHLSEPQNRPDQVKIQYELPVQPSKKDVESVIAAWNNAHEREWDDYGFKLKGEPRVHWLSHSLARKEFELNITRNSLEVVNTGSLLTALTKNKAEILKLIS